MADVINIPQIVWKILGISSQLLSQYRTPQDQLLWLIFIPNLIVIFFIYWFSTRFAFGHVGFRNLFAIAAYLTLVLTGWYGRLIPFFITWWWILLGMNVFLFLLSRIFSPSKSRETFDIAGAAGEAAVGKIFERRKAQKDLKNLRATLISFGINPDKNLAGQHNFDVADRDPKVEMMRYKKQYDELKRKATEWV